MKILLNHTELALNIKNKNLENALTLLQNKINMLLSLTSSKKEFKKLLYSINIFTYSYLCTNSSLTLEDLCNENLKLIENCDSKEDLIILGEEIIRSYINATDSGKSTPENEIIKNALTYIHLNIEKK